MLILRKCVGTTDTGKLMFAKIFQYNNKNYVSKTAQQLKYVQEFLQRKTQKSGLFGRHFLVESLAV